MNKKQSDEELIKEAEWAEAHIPDHEVPPLSKDGFEKILEHLENDPDDTCRRRGGS